MTTRLHTIWKTIWPNKIRNQLVAGIAVVHVVLMAIFVYDMVRREKAFLKKQNAEHAFNLVSNFAVNAETYLITNDYSGIQRVVSSYRNFPYLKYIMLVSPEGEVLAHSDIRNAGTQLADTISRKMLSGAGIQTLIADNDLLDIAVPVVNQNRIIGWARTGIGQEYIHDNLLAISRNGLIYILIALAVGTAFALFIAHGLSRKLYDLIHTARQITSGQRHIRSDNSSTFEIGELSKAFNQMLDEISANEKMMGMILENMPVGVWILDPNGQVLSANSESRKIWAGIRYVGIDGFDEFKGWFRNTGHPVQANEWGGARAVTKGETSINEEIEIECFDGSHKIILNSALPLFDDQGKIVRAIVINVDITEKRKAENALQRVSHVMNEREKELNCLYRLSELSNDPAKTMEEILQDCVKLIPSAYQYPGHTTARIRFVDAAYFSPGFSESSWKQEASINSTLGQIGKLEVFYTGEIPAEQETPFLKEEQLLINSIADILANSAERKKSEIELRHSEEKFRSLIEQNLVGVVILQDWRFLYVNPGLAEMTGYSKEHLENQMTFKELIHPEDLEMVRNNYLLRISGRKLNEQYIFRARNRAGRTLYAEAIVSQIMFNGEPAVIATIMNITSRVEEEKRLDKAVNDAQEAERMQIGMELHDNVQQIMVGSLIFIDFAKRKIDDKTVIEKTLTDVSAYINDAINELRRLSHRLSPSLGLPGSFKDKIGNLVSATGKTAGIHFSIEADKELPQMRDDIQVAFYRIVQEQLSNIFKYANASEVKIILGQVGQLMQLQVRDNGRGFDMQTVKKGIGLENIRRRAHVLGGNTNIVSSPGEGCELVVQIPLAGA